MPTMPAILGPARLGNFRLGYESPALAAERATTVRILLAGVEARTRVRLGSLTIRDILNDTPNTASLVVQDTAPSVGQDLRVLVNSDAPVLLFNGQLQEVDLSYEGKPTQTVWRCTAIDDTARVNYRRPFGSWTTISATTVAQELIAEFAPDFTTNGVELGLPAITLVLNGTEGVSGALRQIAKLIGGYFYFEDLDLHLFQTEAAATPDPLAPGYPFADDPPIAVTTDDSQLMTRVYGKGHGEPSLSDVLAGDTIVPLNDAVMFNPGGGQAITESQILTYTGIQLGGGGGLIGPGAAPSAPPFVALVPGVGLGTGIYQYAYTDVTALGESLPSPLAPISTVGVTLAPSFIGTFGTAVGAATAYRWAYTFRRVLDGAETDLSPVSNQLFADLTSFPYVLLSTCQTAPSGFVRQWYRTVSFGSVYKRVSTNIAVAGEQGSGYFVDSTPDGSLGATAPTANGTEGKQVAVSGIAVGPSGTTSRKVYRTVVDGAQLKLHTTIANNTATTIATDVIADGSLGANAPTSDGSGLAQPSGQVNAGSTSLIVAGTGPFAAAGGWAILGNGQQVLRYTGVTSTALTGVPASGPGSIAATVSYNTTISAAPALSGVTGLGLALLRGAPVHLWVQRDDPAAQAVRSALDFAQGRVSDGVVEGPPIVDERRGEASLMALCDATLQLFAYPLVSVTYATRDLKTKSGKTIVINLATPAVSETLTIQEVTISEIGIAPGLGPKFTAMASAVRFSLEDLLRRLATVGA